MNSPFASIRLLASVEGPINNFFQAHVLEHQGSHRKFRVMADTPMMRQYEEAKRVCPDALLLFRMGDFYELFQEDARTAARVLNLSLTSREKGENAMPMAGFPHHQLDNYLAKLIHAGYRAAICDQVQNPKEAKGLVKREVTRIVTPGTLTDDALLDPRECNYLAAVVATVRDRETVVGLAWVDMASGRLQAADFTRERLADELARIAPSECLIPEDSAPLPPSVVGKFMVTRRPSWCFGAKTAAECLRNHFQTATLAGFGFDDESAPAIGAAGAILEYLAETQRASIAHVDRLEAYSDGSTLRLDEASRRGLEISRSIRDGRREGTLLGVLDRTVTSMGARVLSEWAHHPTTLRATIEERLDAVAELVENPPLTSALREKLKGVHDLERLLGRITTGRATPRDLSHLGKTLGLLPAIKAKLTGRRAPFLNQLESELDLCPELFEALAKSLEDDCPLTSREGGFIRAGRHAGLDQLRELTSGGKQWLARYQAEEGDRAGIPSLKVGYNKVFGYYIEITNVHREKVPSHYIRKQTVKNAERYITPELKEHEEQVLTAAERAQELEYELFLELRDQVTKVARRIQGTARALARLDVLASLADLARDRGYCRPTISEEPVLKIVDGRHPVLDVAMPAGEFVPNDASAGSQDGLLFLITGPNMAGKSTYIRQIALLTLMAQMGSFVPARKATIGIADRIFARIGASDELARGQSTFMVEMVETARILNSATPRSLVILDEIGRGTSTYDGVSLAWAVVEFLHNRIGCRCFFATHYHELTELATELAGVRNLNVAVQEHGDGVVFLHRIEPGPAGRSYGIHVARLAGVPREVTARAERILMRLEESGADQPTDSDRLRASAARDGNVQLLLFDTSEHPLLAEIRELNAETVTPLEALNRIYQWREQLRSTSAEASRG